jgi:hypothetical protein
MFRVRGSKLSIFQAGAIVNVVNVVMFSAEAVVEITRQPTFGRQGQPTKSFLSPQNPKIASG